MRLGDFLDVHAAGGAGHKNNFANAAIDENAEIEFALDVEAFFDENALDGAAAGAGLRGDKIHAEHVRSDVRGFIRRVSELDAAGFAAAAGMNLRFHNDYAGSEPWPRLRGLPPWRKPLRREEW